MKKKFKVYLSAVGNVEATVEVEAKSSEEATDIAVEKAQKGDVVWVYNGVDDSTIEADDVSETTA